MRFTVKFKLIAAFGIVILLTSFFGLYSISSLKSENDRSEIITDVWLKSSDLAYTMDTAISDYRIKEYKHVLSQDQKTMDDTEKELQQLKDKFEKALDEYDNDAQLKDEKDLIRQIKEEYPKYIEISNTTVQISKELNKEEATNLIRGVSKQSFDRLKYSVSELVRIDQNQANLENLKSDKIYEQSRLMLIITTAVIILISILVAVYIIRNITKSINSITGFINRTADLDLVYDQNELNSLKKSKDEFSDMGMALSEMRKVLRELIENIKQNSVNVSSNANNLSTVIGENSDTIDGVAKAIDEMAQGSAELAKNIEYGADKLTLLADDIGGVVKSADSMQNYINITSEANSQGMHYIEKLKQAVGANDELAAKVVAQFEALDSKSQSIGKITDAIKVIASQINLLALNAAIEAARAGEQGRGFAVVASEIRKLAYETANSIKEIDVIVTEVQNQIYTTKAEMAKAETVLGNMLMVTNGTDEAFKAIDSSVSSIIKQINSLINSINAINNNKNEVVNSITDMSAIAEELASNTQEISASMQEQSASMEQISEASKDLNDISLELRNLIAKFRT